MTLTLTHNVTCRDLNLKLTFFGSQQWGFASFLICNHVSHFDCLVPTSACSRSSNSSFERHRSQFNIMTNNDGNLSCHLKDMMTKIKSGMQKGPHYTYWFRRLYFLKLRQRIHNIHRFMAHNSLKVTFSLLYTDEDAENQFLDPHFREHLWRARWRRTSVLLV